MPAHTLLSVVRRRSSARSAQCINSPRSLKISAVYSGCILPAEVLESIVAYAFSSERSFSALSGFASASYAFRQIALRCFCSHLHICTIKHWDNMPDVSKVSGWTRSISATAHALTAPAASQLHSFCLLKTVYVTFHGHSIINYNVPLHTLLGYLPDTITELSLVDLPDISPGVLGVIAKQFSELTRLELSCTERLDDACCWGCFEESASCVNHSPIPDNYRSVEEMTNFVRNALRPLAKLQHLHLGFFLSPTDLIYEHLTHVQEQLILPGYEPEVDSDEDEDNGANGGDDDDTAVTEGELSVIATTRERSAQTEAERNKPFGPEWCLLCFERYAAGVRLAELQAGLELAQTFKHLKTLGWGSFFGRQKQEMSSRRTNIWIFRKDGKIRVRRKPWLAD